MQSALTIKNIDKRFPGVHALNNVSIDFHKGEIHALIGMNGSGKSTLLKILTGVCQKDSGEIIIDGQEQRIRNVQDSRALGISMVFQELSLVPYLTVAENISMGHLPSRGGLINQKEMTNLAKEQLERLSVAIDPGAYVEDLSVAEKQMVEIAKALSTDARVLLLDEPSAVLTQSETKSLFKLVKALSAEGVTIVYISHRLEEVFEIADRVTVLRDGVMIGTKEIKELEAPDLVKMMINRTMDDLFPEAATVKSNEKALEVKGLCKGQVQDASFHINKQEILGIYGVVGAGQKELVESLFGVDTKDMKIDEYKVGGRHVNIKTPKHAIDAGLAYMPEERKKDGLMLDLNIRENTVITFLKRLSNAVGLVDTSQEKSRTQDLIAKLSVKATSADVIVRTLSGGNQQKIVIAKWLGRGSDLYICFEPTRGIDVNAKAQVYEALEQARREGASILIVSSELTEVMGMCERLYVLNKGRIVSELGRSEWNQEMVLAKAAGLEV